MFAFGNLKFSYISSDLVGSTEKKIKQEKKEKIINFEEKLEFRKKKKRTNKNVCFYLKILKVLSHYQ